MAVTVEQILKLGALSQARVLSGSRGLDRAVSSVTVGEVPDIAEWLSGGEIVLSTMFALTNDTDRQRDFCRRIMAAGASALFVKPKRFVGSFPLDILEIADKRNFPIVEVPQEIRWTRIMQEAMEVLINRQASLLEKSQEIHRDLLEVVINGGLGRGGQLGGPAD
ncbi:MAG: PucR family transcriptional regulator ligand-binding domain-containing protein [Thermoleophilia bacterium]|nr:PucR family transcriptional regulator ligand-binding domain-containing protein [Thermoleophilia bacterium]